MEHEGELPGTLNIFGCSYVCDRVMWIRREHGSYHLKGPCEDQILGYEALTLVDGSVSVCLIFVFGYVE